MTGIPVVDILSRLDELSVSHQFLGDSSTQITTAASPDRAQDHCLFFLREFNQELIAGVCNPTQLWIVPNVEGVEMSTSDLKSNFLLVEVPELTFCIVGGFISDSSLAESGIHPSSFVHPDAQIGKNVSVGPMSVIGENVQIEDNVRIGSHVEIQNALVQSGTQIGSGTKIGGSGLGSIQDASGKWWDAPHFRRVLIGENVNIQENVVVHRGKLSDTIIGSGTRIGPLAWIGHGVRVGENCFIAQAVTIAGSAHVMSGASVWGNAAVREKTVIHEKSMIGAGSVVLKDVPANEVHAGAPAKLIRTLKC